MSSFPNQNQAYDAVVLDHDQPSRDYAQYVIAYHRKNGFSVFSYHISSLFLCVLLFYGVPSPSLRPFCDALLLVFQFAYV